jgi:hypothetical protein
MLRFSNEAIRDAAEAITSGVISAEEVFGTMASLGCDWDTLVVAHVDEVSDGSTVTREQENNILTAPCALHYLQPPH